MASTTLPRLVCRSRLAVAAVVLLTFLVALTEVPHAATPKTRATPAAWA